jgi:hypothetical protein
MIIHWGIEGDLFRVYNNGELFQEFGEDRDELIALAFLLLEGEVEIVKENGHALEISEERDRIMMARDLLNVFLMGAN